MEPADRVDDWLRQIGLAQYIEPFRSNDIDREMLRQLTNDDLKEIGVLSLGHRRRLLAAIADLIAPVPAAPPAAQAAPRAAERRQLTVMFVDLVASTELSSRLDPEEMSEILRRYQDVVVGEISRLGGHVAKLMGDGVLAYFGWPVAYEDAAERAVRAGLMLGAAVQDLGEAIGHGLASRTGIATGLVVVGELIGTEEALERAVVGETPNLAARLQAVAPPGGVVIAQGTQRLLGQLFDMAELPPLELRGLPGQHRAWHVLGEGRAVGRFEALHGGTAGELVGREQELGLLLDRWRLAKSGEGQVVVLSAEPGIGKSRIIVALEERLRSEIPTTLRYFCSPLHTGTPFWPVIKQLEHGARMTTEDTASIRLDKLAALLLPPDNDDAVPLLADLLSIPTGDRYPPLNITPEEKKLRTMRMLAGQLAPLSRAHPVLIILEDAHWLDPTTRQLFDLIVDRVQDLRVLCVVACRPEFQSSWSGRAHVTMLSMNRLGRVEAERMMALLTRDRRLPAPLREAILLKTEGIPLFVEELTKMILESGQLVVSGNELEPDAPLGPLTIPDTLRDSLMARLDRFPAAREIAQVAALLGREFDLELLATVSGSGSGAVTAALERLMEAGLVFRRGVPPNVYYVFKHALVQDTAYQSLLKSRRQQLHVRAAEALRSRFRDRIEAAPELLAHHLTEAGHTEDAVGAWLAAGLHSLRRSAYSEVIAQMRKGLALAETLPASPQKNLVQMRLFNALGQALQSSRGPVAEVESSYRRARELSDAAGEMHEWVRASYGLWFCQNSRMEHDTARRSAEELLARMEHGHDSALVLQAHHAAWTTAWQLGKPQEAVAHAEIGRSLYVPEEHHVFTAIESSHDAGVCCRCTLGVAHALLGHVDRAVAAGTEAGTLGRRISHPFSLALSLFFRSKVHLWRGEVEITADIVRELIELCDRSGIGHYGLAGKIMAGWCAATSGADQAGGIRLMRSSLDELAQNGVRARRTEYLGLLAERAIAVGDLALARTSLMEAHRLAGATGERFFLAELHRLDAVVSLAEDARARDEAERHLRQALETARVQETKLFELRAAMDLARLWADRGERRRAHDLLAPVHDWFTEGAETPRLTEARKLRDMLH